VEVYLVRHGESEQNAGVTDARDSALSGLGLRQAEAAGQALRGCGIERIYCSLQQRGLHTASLIGRQLGLRPQGWLELCERGYCMTEPGLSLALIRSRYPGVDLPASADERGWARHWKSETMEALARRMAKVARQLEALARGEVEAPTTRAADAPAHAASVTAAPTAIAMVVHFTSCSMMLRRLLGVTPESDAYFAHDNSGISLLHIAGSETVLRRLNDTRHLARAGLLAARGRAPQ
jgi:broad specificity phosphatase PhoE